MGELALNNVTPPLASLSSCASNSSSSPLHTTGQHAYLHSLLLCILLPFLFSSLLPIQPHLQPPSWKSLFKKHSFYEVYQPDSVLRKRRISALPCVTLPHSDPLVYFPFVMFWLCCGCLTLLSAPWGQSLQAWLCSHLHCSKSGITSLKSHCCETSVSKLEIQPLACSLICTAQSTSSTKPSAWIFTHHLNQTQKVSKVQKDHSSFKLRFHVSLYFLASSQTANAKIPWERLFFLVFNMYIVVVPEGYN